MTDRRQFLAATASLIAVSVAASLRAAALAAAPAAGDAGARLNALFDVFMDERFAKNPQSADQPRARQGQVRLGASEAH